MSSKAVSLHARDHPVQAVTIFQSSTAQLTRTFVVDLKGGSNVLEICGISSRIDQESPKIYGLGTEARVFDISCNNLIRAPHQRHTKNAAAVKRLEAKRKLLKAERDVRQTEFTLLDDAARSIAQDKITSLDSLMDTFVARKRNAIASVIEMGAQIEELDTEIWLLNNSHEGHTSAVVTATLLAKRDCKVEFHLDYLVTGVIWKPYYDLHATKSEGKPSPDVSLHYCANITQSTGEDWTNVILTLSTANSHAIHSLTVPKLDPLRLVPSHPPPPVPPRTIVGAVPQPPQPQSQQAKLRSRTSNLGPRQSQPQRVPHYVGNPVVVPTGTIPTFAVPSSPPGTYGIQPQRERLFPEESDTDSAEYAAVVPPALTPDPDVFPLAEGSVLHRSPLSLAYRVEGKVTLPSDGVAHKVPIAVLAFEAALKYVCVPRRTAAAFIEGRIENTSEYELLAGPVSVFMDDNFVTKTTFGLIGVNESFTCVLGIDPSLKVSYETKSHTEHEPKRSFAEPSKTTTRTITTTITNGHSFDLTGLVVRDAIPLGNADANIKVALRKPDGLAQAKDGEDVTVTLPGVGDAAGQEAKVRWARTESGGGGEKEGLYEWVCELKAGKKVRLEAEWEVKAPSTLRWEEQLNIQFGRKRD